MLVVALLKPTTRLHTQFKNMSLYLDKNIVEAIDRIDVMSIDELKAEFERFGLSAVPLKRDTPIKKEVSHFERDMSGYKNLRLSLKIKCFNNE
jgi:hypothetical protein